jgi:hypothetical protein
LLKLQQKKIFEARAEQPPRSGEPRDSAADYDRSRAFPLIIRKSYAKPAAEAMSRCVGCANDLSLRQRRLNGRTASGNRYGQAEKRCEYFSPREVLCCMGTGWH